MVRRFAIGLGLLLALVAAPAEAQEAVVSGTILDSTGGVLPGVTVTATHTASGNTFVAVTDERGGFRLSVRVGAYRVAFELSSFSPVTRTLELLVGQQAVINVEMSPSTVQETVTVTAEAPLIDVTRSNLNGNIDSRQLQDLPLNGRNWQELALLAPGNRANAAGDAPIGDTTAAAPIGSFQLNIDGLQVTNLIAGVNFGNPRFSRDAIAEFEFVANRFDARQGRSSGVQVNAVSKSGTNTPSGTFAGYFRNDRFNAADHVTHRILPYSDSQLSATWGGPIRKDRMHIFGNVEYEREPQSFAYATPYPRFNFDVHGIHREKLGGLRGDLQFSPKSRMSVRYSAWTNEQPYSGVSSGGSPQASSAVGGSTSTPDSALETDRYTYQVIATPTQVLSNHAVNELKVGYANYGWTNSSHIRNPNSPAGTGFGAPTITLRALTIGNISVNSPQHFDQKNYSVRDDLTVSYDWNGRHDLSTGGEYLRYNVSNFYCYTCQGQLVANVAPRPANLEDLFPDLFDATTWNPAALSPIAISWTQGFGNMRFPIPRNVVGVWVQDDWAVTSRLTLNLGVRYDLQRNAFVNDLEILPFIPGNRPQDTDNVAPRFGAVYRLNDRTVLRGGAGKFFGDTGIPFSTEIQRTAMLVTALNDGRPDFASNPFNGPPPTFEQIKARVCTPAAPFSPGCIRRDINGPNPNAQIPFSYQASMGMERQFGTTMALAADYLFTGTRGDNVGQNVNLTYNPATRANYPYTDLARRPYPDWGVVSISYPRGRSNLQMLDVSFRKRFSHRWQASGNYTVSGLWDAVAPPVTDVDFTLVPDLGAEYAPAANDQRHRLVFNGIWDIARGLQLSGLYFFGSGQRFSTIWGPDLRLVGSNGANRLRPDGTLVPRNAFVGNPIHRVDVRLQQRVPVRGRVRVDGMLEVFNLFNHKNYGSYTTQESSSSYGQPSYNVNIAYVPRSLQLGFRIGF